MARMVSLARTAKEKAEAMKPVEMEPSDMPDVPYGMCICLTDRELEMLGIDDDVDQGDLLHLRVMVQATSVHKDGNGTRIECSIIAGTAEDEMDEDEEDEDA